LSQILPEVRSLALSGIAPARLLFELNRVVAAELPMDCFVTAAAFELDAQAKVLTVANAAHVPGMLRTACDGLVSLVGHASGVALGMGANTRYLDERYDLNAGDVLVLMTDGVLEAMEPDLLSMSAVKRLLAEAAYGGREAHQLLLNNLAECCQGRATDDMTLVTLEVISESRVETESHLARAS
jgi:sigma-B regulation protein RsbU (phosphoserine phosphatase)